MRYELVIVGALETNCYLVYCDHTRECAIIDPGADPEKIFPVIAELELKPALILNTHGHVDHIGANSDMKEKFHVPLCIHPLDSPMLQEGAQFELGLFLGAKASPPADRLLNDGDRLDIGRSSLEIIHTPGPSPGSVCLRGDGLLFSGDTLFFEGVGRTDLAGGSWKDLEKSIRTRVLVLPDSTLVLPGHGPLTTIAQEKTTNPILT